MLIEILSFFFFIFNLFLIILVIMQKNYGGFWSGPSGNDSVMIFGGNQGADILQKITWFFGTVLILGSLSLSIYEAKVSQVSAFYKETKTEDKVKIDNTPVTDNKMNKEETIALETEKVQEKK